METLFDVDAANAERIIIPSGDDNEPCIAAFQQTYDIEIPAFAGKCREATSQGRTFYKQKGIDIPWMIGDGLADIGLTGTDSALEDAGYRSRYIYKTIGQPMCRFVLLSTMERNLASKRDSMRDSNLAGYSSVEQVATSFPRYFSRVAASAGLPLVPYPREIRGGVEGVVRRLGLQLAADLVVSGDSAGDNKLTEVETLDYVFPAVIKRIVSNVQIGEYCDNR